MGIEICVLDQVRYKSKFTLRSTHWPFTIMTMRVYDLSLMSYAYETLYSNQIEHYLSVL